MMDVRNRQAPSGGDGAAEAADQLIGWTGPGIGNRRVGPAGSLETKVGLKDGL